jgi:hypothetical protein
MNGKYTFDIPYHRASALLEYLRNLRCEIAPEGDISSLLNYEIISQGVTLGELAVNQNENNGWAKYTVFKLPSDPAPTKKLRAKAIDIIRCIRTEKDLFPND